jgi:hypothetical protein
LLLLLCAGQNACRKDEAYFRPFEASVDDIEQALQQVPAPQASALLSLRNWGSDTIFATPSGTRLFLQNINQLFVNQAGVVVPCSSCADFRLEVTEISQKGDHIARSVPTVLAENGQVIEMGMALQVVARCNGQTLNLAPGQVLRVQVPGLSPSANNWAYQGLEAGGDFLGWSGSNNQTPTIAAWQLPGSGQVETGLEFSSTGLGWLALGRPLTGAGHPFCASLPPGYTDENTRAYLVFRNLRAVTALEYDPETKLFCAENVPAGFPVQVLSISKVGAAYQLGLRDTETADNSRVLLAPETTSEQSILDLLKAL